MDVEDDKPVKDKSGEVLSIKLKFNTDKRARTTEDNSNLRFNGQNTGHLHEEK